MYSCHAGKPTEARPGVRRRCDAFKNGRATASRYKPRDGDSSPPSPEGSAISGRLCRYFAATRTRRHRFSESSNCRSSSTVASGTGAQPIDQFPAETEAGGKRRSSSNQQRDERSNQLHEREGWKVFRFWEHDRPEDVATLLIAAIAEAGRPHKGWRHHWRRASILTLIALGAFAAQPAKYDVMFLTS